MILGYRLVKDRLIMNIVMVVLTLLFVIFLLPRHTVFQNIVIWPCPRIIPALSPWPAARSTLTSMRP